MFFLLEKKYRAKLTGKADDADTDSYSDPDFEIEDDNDKNGPLDEKEKIRNANINLELLAKRFFQKNRQYNIKNFFF